MSSVFCSANTYSKNVFKINKIKPTKTKIKVSCSVSNWRERVTFFIHFWTGGSVVISLVGYIVLVVLFVVAVIILYKFHIIFGNILNWVCQEIFAFVIFVSL